MSGKNGNLGLLTEIYPMVVSASSRANPVSDRAFLEISPPADFLYYEFGKQLVEPILALMVLLVLAPLFLLIALLVKVSSPGPVFYTQERIGKGGLPFRIFKFRSMYNHSEPNGPTLSWDNDPRVTAVGQILRRFHLDELPQFYNVLIGDMSVIGPRPERQFFVEQLVAVAPQYKHLARVKPGITSLGQIKFGYAENLNQMTERMKFDLYYLRNASPTLDLQILMGTLSVIYSKRRMVHRKLYHL